MLTFDEAGIIKDGLQDVFAKTPTFGRVIDRACELRGFALQALQILPDGLVGRFQLVDRACERFKVVPDRFQHFIDRGFAAVERAAFLGLQRLEILFCKFEELRGRFIQCIRGQGAEMVRHDPAHDKGEAKPQRKAGSEGEYRQEGRVRDLHGLSLARPLENLLDFIGIKRSIPMRSRQSGNILLYVLIAVVLFGMLSFMLTKQSSDDGAAGSVAEGKSRFRGEDLMNYATNMRAAIEQMIVMQNVLPTELSFVRPGESGYDNAPHIAKVYHPVGGGVSQFNAKDEIFEPGSAKRGWVAQQGTNVQWTQTSSSDVILTFLDIESKACSEINKRLYKDSSIPTTTIDASAVFINGGGDDADFTISACPSCNGRNSYCIKDSGGNNVFYNIVLAR